MIRDRADFLTLVLLVGGLALIVGAFAGTVVPEYAAPIVIGAMGLPLVLGGWKHLSLNGRATEADIDHTERTNYALYLANEERQRKLEAVALKAPPPPDTRRDWHEAAHRFVTWGAVYGFTIRALAADHSPGKCIAWNEWRGMVDVLVGLGVLVDAGNRTRWAEGWDIKRWDDARDGFNYPPTPAPEVAIPLLGAVTTPATPTTVV
jgi:hypothetical protein